MQSEGGVRGLGGITNQWVMKQQSPSAGEPEDNNTGRIKMAGVCVQATDQQGF